MCNDDDDSGTRIDPESHKEHPKTIDDDDDKTEKEKKDDETNDEKANEDEKKDETGSMETRKEKMQTPIPSPLDPLRKTYLRIMLETHKLKSGGLDSIISLGQKNTLAEYMILFGVDNRPPMLDKDLYDSWKSRMELYMQNREHEIMILESVENSPFIWPTIEENSVIRTKKYAELFAAKKIQADCDMKAINIIVQGLPVDIY
ncbi:hypothetical protein Tco_0128075 [Tanacetum coccineum]